MGLSVELLSAIGLALALSIDSFAVSLGAIKVPVHGVKRELFFSRTSLMFATVQTLLFFLGFLLGKSSLKFFNRIDHWVGASILLFLAYNVWRGRNEAIWSGEVTTKKDLGVTLGTTFLAALATSLDAFGAGTSTAFNGSNLAVQLVCIFIITAGAVMGALHAGHKISPKVHKKLPHFSTVVLVLLAVKIVLGHS